MLKYGSLTALLLLFFLTGKSQIVAGNAFLEGLYIKLGMAPNGAFGSSVNAPPGFMPPGADIRNSPVCNQGKVGFVADLGKDGWTTGSPAFMGDYFLPGTPEEGWGVSINSTNYNNARSSVLMPAPADACLGGTQIPGGFTLFEDLGDRQVAHWEGIINGLKIIKKITLPKNKLYFITEIKLVNTTAAPLIDVYYMRNVDPDNEVVAASTTEFITNNRVEYQNPLSANKALVSATGRVFGSYLGLGTIDCRAKVAIGGTSGATLANRVPKDVYDAAPPRLGTLNAQLTSDVAIAIAFRVGDIAPLDTIRIAFAYILAQADLEEALARTAPAFDVNGISVTSGGNAINCTGDPVPITITNGEDYTWTWSPGTGLSTTSGPTVIYTPQPTPITYTITGTNAVCNDATLTITMYPPNTQLASFDETLSCGNKTVLFTNTSLTVGDPDATYKWDFGDGSPVITATSPTHTFPDFGTYNVKLSIVTDVPVCETDDTIITKPIELWDKPVLSATAPAALCIGTPGTFNGSATIGSGTIVSHQWTFPGGIVYNTASVTHNFSTPGTFDVIYEVTSDRGCVESITKTVIVESIPVADFDAANSCVNKTVTFTNNSTISVGTISQYEWDFGNGQTSTQATPSTSYATHGIKTITLKASTANGCSDTYTSTIDVESNPVADFEFGKACPGLVIPFTNRSSNEYGVIGSYLWTFEPGQTSTAIHPSYTYNVDGNYTVTLQATSTGGCVSELKTQTIPIRAVNANAGKDTLVFKDSPFQLRAKGGITYLWTPGTYLSATNIPNPVGSIQNDQDFMVEVTDNKGCKGTDIVSVQVFKDDDIYVPNSFSPNNDGKNDVFRVIAPPGVVYLFEVYDRWGKRVFTTADQQKGWNGKIQEILQPSGVYVWHLRAKTRQGREVTKKGTVMLIW